ncbi:hypothetical protein [Corynebacterium doosanense]|uniref:Secreted protein n=1 Tax=Corynebacterium doosanense CAU 212 = DSM 45436 TaxID=558173 RepID=A0A097IET1_9CORY|nr:hypothetical protein [Corynebacterium doosanense]AIT60633.1 hypothetical protein CDOO_04740 [Corynebacterium doosanense CAU 212 = DSM 45436]
MKLKRTLATLAAAGIALTTLAPTAGAAPVGNTVALLVLANGQIATADCGLVGGVLRGTGLVNETTTRSELVTSLHRTLAGDIQTKLITAQTIGVIGDRALECGVVKADPNVPAGSSQLMDVVALLSSEVR